jgi:stage V sporulation protein G
MEERYMTTELEITVVKMHKTPDNSRIKAFVDIVINDAILIKGLRVVDGVNGLFVSMPSELGKNERWYERVRCLNEDLKGIIAKKVLQAYEE